MMRLQVCRLYRIYVDELVLRDEVTKLSADTRELLVKLDDRQRVIHECEKEVSRLSDLLSVSQSNSSAETATLLKKLEEERYVLLCFLYLFLID
jgi:GTP cyclohydrolase FolE2